MSNIDHFVQLYAQLDQELKELNELVAAKKTERDEIGHLIQEEMGEHTSFSTPDFTVRWYPPSRRLFDVKRFRDEHPDVADEYTRTSDARRFEVVPNDS